MTMIRENILRVQDNISIVCKRLGRNPKEIILVGVTKYSLSDSIQEALDSGLCHIGENKVQDALTKYQNLQLNQQTVMRHMIGHLQTNKVKQALEIFDVIQSVDSLRLAQAIEKQCQRLNRTIDVFIQVKTSGEDRKFGVLPEDTFSLLKQLSDCPCLRVCGLMTLALWSHDKRLVRDCFKKLKYLYDRIKDQFSHYPNIQMRFLSMGMTDDYVTAIEEGANMVRIGRAIFGP